MSVKLGVAPIAWSNDDMPELGGETTLEQCLAEARQAGFTGIESCGKFPKNSSELIPKLNQFNLNLCSGWYGANLRNNSVEKEKKLIHKQLTLFKDCKAPCIVLAEVSGSIQGYEDVPIPLLSNIGGVVSAQHRDKGIGQTLFLEVTKIKMHIFH